MITIQAAILQAPIARLDAQVLLAHVLSVPRSYCLTRPERTLTEAQQAEFAALVQRRAQGEPVAYLTGHREFWSLDFFVNEHCLIPRPETELLVEAALSSITKPDAIVADLGTGSGAIAVSLAVERPTWQVIAIDQSAQALEVAKRNAAQHGAKRIRFIENDWLTGLSLPPLDAIITNPPYIAPDCPHLSEDVKAFEPTSALIAQEAGLADIKRIISQAKGCLAPGGRLLLEHGFDQAEAVQDLLKNAGYQAIETKEDLAGLPRISAGQMGNID